MTVQTVFRAGNSNVVAIPKSLGDKYGLKNGSKIVVEEHPESGGVLIKKSSQPAVKDRNSQVTTEFKKWLKQALEEDGQILDELANR